MNNQVSL